MAKPAGLNPERAYVFSDYFCLNFDLEDILAYFGYGFERPSLPLPQTSQPLDLHHQHITQGLTLYRVPEEVESIQRIWVGILQPDASH